MLNLLQSKYIFLKGNIKFVAQSSKIVLMQQTYVKLKDYCSCCTVKSARLRPWQFENKSSRQ